KSGGSGGLVTVGGFKCPSVVVIRRSRPRWGRFQCLFAVMMAFAFSVPRAGRFQCLFAVMMAFAFSVPCAGRFQRPFAVKLRRFFCHAANG
ncbi:hypothetical protein ACSZOD_20640, partial [Aeromonas hydrophila]